MKISGKEKIQLNVKHSIFKSLRIANDTQFIEGVDGSTSPHFS